jgi:nicotinamidase-related amidase
MRCEITLGLLSLLLASTLPADSLPQGSGGQIHLTLRTRVQPFPTAPDWKEAHFDGDFSTAKSAIIITDMWDKHWCHGATMRVGEIARRMEPLLNQARAAGVLIIHAPSDTMSYYADAAGRKLAEDAPQVTPPQELTLEDPPLPIDDSDGGCDTPGDKEHKAWSRETSLLTIAPGDVISDQGKEIYSVLRKRGITTVFFMGVHVNMCILNRTFGIRQLSRWGVHCVLVRDLTDAMYHSSSRPFVSHAAGTELVIEYIEQHYAPTVTSADMMQALSGHSASTQGSGITH